MNKEQLLQIKETVSSVLEVTGHRLIEHYGKIAPDSKSDTESYTADIVTRLDRETEDYISSRLREEYPEIGFRGEESGDSNKNESDELTWLVDPIDGTSHYVRGLPFCSTMIALIEHGRVVFCAIHDFTQNDLYWAIRDHGAFRNETRLKLTERSFESSVISFETNLDVGDNKNIHAAISGACGGLVSTLNCGFEFTRIASGQLDGKITKDPFGKDWDFAPGSLLVEEAGGIVRNHKSKTYNYKNHDFTATSRTVYQALTSMEATPF